MSGPNHTVVDRSAWLAAQRDHLSNEKALTRHRDEVAAKRRELPWLAITEPYEFIGPDGAVDLAELFGPHRQLVLWHFMYGADWTEGCPSCSFWADSYNGTQEHLAARNTALCAVSIAPYEAIAGYQQRMGWTFPWYSSAFSSFNVDLGVTFSAEQIEAGDAGYNFGTAPPHSPEAHGLSAFTRDDAGQVYLTYQTFSRGVDAMNSAYQMLDLTAAGRDEASLPWPMAWLRRHDEYAAEG
ncbi:MAG: DUF899 domain-containing protein [Actinomycetota bacterium]